MKLKSQAGFSIIEILIGAGIVMIVALAFASLTTSLMKELKGVTQKADSAEIRNGMIIAFANSNVCSWQLQGKTIRTSGVTATNSSSTNLVIPTLYAGLDTNSYVIAKADTNISISQSSLKVQDIHLKDIFSTGNPDEYVGTIYVSFDDESLVRPLKSVTTQVVFFVNPADPANSRRIVGCTSAGAKSFLLNNSYLKQFHTQVAIDCTNMNTGKMYWDSACFRFCSVGCEPGGEDQSCTSPIMGKGYPGGVAVECGGSKQKGVCLCLR